MERKRRKADTPVPCVCIGAQTPVGEVFVLFPLLPVGGQDGGEHDFIYLRGVAVIVPRTAGIWGSHIAELLVCWHLESRTRGVSHWMVRSYVASSQNGPGHDHRHRPRCHSGVSRNLAWA